MFRLSNVRAISRELRLMSTASSAGKLFDKILIANRGEIACRVMRTAKRMGVKTVAVYSDADANSMHVQMADEAIHIGGNAAQESYLRGEKIIAAAKKTGAQAIHPGYGFLSENLEFCSMCTDAGVVFIGPPPNAIRAMGSKSESKDIMIKASVPVTPGYHGDNQDDKFLLEKAKEIGFPVMIKAVSGGGGKGMRAVFEGEKFQEALDAARREALKSFNDDVVLIEKLVQAPRHVELQVFGDMHGDAVHLLERDCSIQRRHQKVLEEAPAPNLPPAVRKSMGDAAVACAKAVGYVGAGTVEFLVDSVTNEFYFCEMNTRLQVEHPVTEMITGQDLVEWQLRIASGQKIPLSQEDILARARGCAIEARVYAENPMNGFLPATGKMHHLQTPAEYDSNTTANMAHLSADNIVREPFVRVDSGVRAGDTVSTFYDPMIAKLITFADSRPEAIEKMERALRNFQVAGLPNNIDFLVQCVKHKGFAIEQPTTAFFDHYLDGILSDLEPTPVTVFSDHVALATCAYVEMQRANGRTPDATVSASPWNNYSNDYRNFGSATRQIRLKDSGDRGDVSVGVSMLKDRSIEFSIPQGENSSKSVNCNVLQSRRIIGSRQDKADVTSSVWFMKVEVDKDRYRSGNVSIFKNAAGATVMDVWMDGQVDGDNTHAQVVIPAIDHASSSSASGHSMVTAPMPGRVVKVLVKEGDAVEAGDTLVILEAMKMEHVVSAPCKGVVSLFCEDGANVSEGTNLAEVIAAEHE